MKEIQAESITKAVRELCMKANTFLPEDVKASICLAFGEEESPLAQDILGTIKKNYETAEAENVPICQDTGMACIFLKIGQDVHICGNLTNAVNEGVRQGYTDGYLRKSIVSDPLERVNTKDNTPAFIHTEVVQGNNLEITILPKGCGAENMSALAMLKPSDGRDGVINFVLETVKKAGANPCPPIIIGVGIGGNFDQAPLAAKKALLRDYTQPNKNPYYAQLEDELLEKINKLDIGVQGIGGSTTALAVNIEALPTHIGSLPVAVNINCHVSRKRTVVL